MVNKLKLPHVTLFVSAGPDLELTFESFKRCMDIVDFGDTVFFSEGTLEQTPDWARDFTIYIEKTGSAQASGIHYFRTLPPLMKTSHMLTVDWDAAIIHPECWTDEFLKYDYIGARWPWLPKGKNIGNGGFCLMSKRLIETVARFDIRFDGVLDADIGQKWRPNLELVGFKFASEELAEKFSYERDVPSAPTFGYHALFNMHRHMDDNDMLSMITKLSDHSVKGHHFLELMLMYLALRKFNMYFAFYKRLRVIQSQEIVLERIMRLDPQFQTTNSFLNDMLGMAEKQLGSPLKELSRCLVY